MKEHKAINGEEIEYDESEGILYLHIREPYYTAGRRFGWNGTMIGIGISYDILNFATKKRLALIQITVGNGKKQYQIETIKYTESHSRMHKKGTLLILVPWDDKHFETVESYIDHRITNVMQRW
jgi:hypothetical protein